MWRYERSRARLLWAFAALAFVTGATYGKVYTNKDLQDLPAPTLPPAERPSSMIRPSRAGVPLPGKTEQPEIIERRIASAEQRVWDAQVQVIELERRLLAVRNPFMPRPQLTAEEAAAWEGLDGVERAARVEAQLERARASLRAAQENLVVLQSRPR